MDSQATGEEAKTAKRALGVWFQIGVLALYAFLTLPVLVLIGFAVCCRFLVFADMALRAMPLYLAYWIDRTFYDAGELSPELLPVWVLMTGGLLWPLLALGMHPTLWRSRSWRIAILGYSAAAFAGTVAASCWVFTHAGLFL